MKIQLQVICRKNSAFVEGEIMRQQQVVLNKDTQRIKKTEIKL